MSSKNNTVLLIRCPDRKGIVYSVSNFIFKNEGNIIDSQQHSMGLNGEFFMRLCFDSKDFKLNKKETDEAFSKIANTFDMDFSFNYQNKKKKMGILVSKYDHCLYDILLRHKYGELNVDIPVIISNHKDLWSVAESFDIPFYYVPVKKELFDDPQEARHDAEAQILQHLKKAKVDFVALARYMQILTPEFIDNFPYKIINVHHGFLPAFKGAKPYHQAHDKGVKIVGATAHYATEDLDMGPIIAQDVIRVDHRDEVEDFLAKGRDIEKMVFAKAIKSHIEDKVIVFQNRTIVFN